MKPKNNFYLKIIFIISLIINVFLLLALMGQKNEEVRRAPKNKGLAANLGSKNQGDKFNKVTFRIDHWVESNKSSDQGIRSADFHNAYRLREKRLQKKGLARSSFETSEWKRLDRNYFLWSAAQTGSMKNVISFGGVFDFDSRITETIENENYRLEIDIKLGSVSPEEYPLLSGKGHLRVVDKSNENRSVILNNVTLNFRNFDSRFQYRSGKNALIIHSYFQ